MAMSWLPKYTISNRLISTIREIGESLGEIRGLNLSEKELQKLKIDANERSTYASTSIEGNPLPLTDVKRILKRKKQHIRDTEKEVLNYNNALQELYSLIKKNKFSLNIKSLEEIQKQVTDGLMDNPLNSGKLRKAPVIIRDPKKADRILFISPDHKDVRKLTKELLNFINENIDIIDPIILAGLFHRQFVIIHPFMDGNGRTARLITSAILGISGFDFFEIFSFENYYNENVSRYFNAVGLFGDYYEEESSINHTPWLEYFADGILAELQRVRKSATSKPKKEIRLEPHLREIIKYIKKHGSITQREYASFSERSLASRKIDFDKLLKLEIIQAKGIGRGRYYVLA